MTEEENLNIFGIPSFKRQLEKISQTRYDNVVLFLRWHDGLHLTKARQATLTELFSSIKKTKTRLEIDLRDNYLDDSIMKPLICLLKNNFNCEELILWFPCNYFTDEGVGQLFKHLKQFKKMKYLVINLEWCFNITDKSFFCILKGIKNLKLLENLHFRINKNTYVTDDCEREFKQVVLEELKNIKVAKYNNENILKV